MGIVFPEYEKTITEEQMRRTNVNVLHRITENAYGNYVCTYVCMYVLCMYVHSSSTTSQMKSHAIDL